MDESVQELKAVLEQFVSQMRDLTPGQTQGRGDSVLERLGLGSSALEQNTSLRTATVMTEILTEVREINERLETLVEALTEGR